MGVSGLISPEVKATVVAAVGAKAKGIWFTWKHGNIKEKYEMMHQALLSSITDDLKNEMKEGDPTNWPELKLAFSSFAPSDPNEAPKVSDTDFRIPPETGDATPACLSLSQASQQLATWGSGGEARGWLMVEYQMERLFARTFIQVCRNLQMGNILNKRKGIYYIEALIGWLEVVSTAPFINNHPDLRKAIASAQEYLKKANTQALALYHSQSLCCHLKDAINAVYLATTNIIPFCVYALCDSEAPASLDWHGLSEKGILGTGLFAITNAFSNTPTGEIPFRVHSNLGASSKIDTMMAFSRALGGTGKTEKLLEGARGKPQRESKILPGSYSVDGLINVVADLPSLKDRELDNHFRNLINIGNNVVRIHVSNGIMWDALGFPGSDITISPGICKEWRKVKKDWERLMGIFSELIKAQTISRYWLITLVRLQKISGDFGNQGVRRNVTLLKVITEAASKAATQLQDSAKNFEKELVTIWQNTHRGSKIPTAMATNMEGRKRTYENIRTGIANYNRSATDLIAFRDLWLKDQVDGSLADEKERGDIDCVHLLCRKALQLSKEVFPIRFEEITLSAVLPSRGSIDPLEEENKVDSPDSTRDESKESSPIHMQKQQLARTALLAGILGVLATEQKSHAKPNEMDLRKWTGGEPHALLSYKNIWRMHTGDLRAGSRNLIQILNDPCRLIQVKDGLYILRHGRGEAPELSKEARRLTVNIDRGSLEYKAITNEDAQATLLLLGAFHDTFLDAESDGYKRLRAWHRAIAEVARSLPLELSKKIKPEIDKIEEMFQFIPVRWSSNNTSEKEQEEEQKRIGVSEEFKRPFNISLPLEGNSMNKGQTRKVHPMPLESTKTFLQPVSSGSNSSIELSQSVVSHSGDHKEEKSSTRIAVESSAPGEEESVSNYPLGAFEALIDAKKYGEVQSRLREKMRGPLENKSNLDPLLASIIVPTKTYVDALLRSGKITSKNFLKSNFMTARSLKVRLRALLFLFDKINQCKAGEKSASDLLEDYKNVEGYLQDNGRGTLLLEITNAQRFLEVARNSSERLLHFQKIQMEMEAKFQTLSKDIAELQSIKAAELQIRKDRTEQKGLVDQTESEITEEKEKQTFTLPPKIATQSLVVSRDSLSASASPSAALLGRSMTGNGGLLPASGPGQPFFTHHSPSSSSHDSPLGKEGTSPKPNPN